MNTVGVIAVVVGVVLIYSAVRNKYPQDVIREVMGKPAIHGPITTGLAFKVEPVVPPSAGLSPAAPVVTV